MKQIGWKTEQENKESVLRLRNWSDISEKGEGRKEHSGGRSLGLQHHFKKVQQGCWTSPSRIHLLAQSHIMLERACLSICAMLTHWLGAALRKYDLSVNTGVDPIKTLEKAFKLFKASEFYLLLVKEMGEKKQAYAFTTCWLTAAAIT